MSKENKPEVTIDEKAVVDPSQEPSFVKWEYGDLVMVCSHCGHTEVIEKGLKDGLQFVLPTTSEHKLKLACSKCGVALDMHFTESDEETVVVAKEKYEKWLKEQEEAKTKAEALKEEVEVKVEELDNAVLQEDTAKEPAQGDN